MINHHTYDQEADGELLSWVRQMKEYAPDALEAYTRLEQVILKDGALSRKEKECILVGVNAARRYEAGMFHHTKAALEAGTTLEELAEILSVCILSRGLPAWLEGIKALAFAGKSQKVAEGKTVEATSAMRDDAFFDLDECLNYYQHTFGSKPQWVMDLANYQPATLLHYTNLRNGNLNDGNVPRKLKELTLVAINTSERYPEGVRIHTEGAKSCGATMAELAECHLIAMLTAGMPAWAEGAKLLK
ncbi:carboxymuconolactone decarboxylase family protein [Lentibacillus sp. N15]|uniref:carboxymuconolactone decarboxylase family protein n=1 Tax=Lentibacillus songyuanensis TaxID=3136161 RepID=UPI0031BBA752